MSLRAATPCSAPSWDVGPHFCLLLAGTSAPNCVLCLCRAETERGLSRKHIIEGGCCTWLCLGHFPVPELRVCCQAPCRAAGGHWYSGHSPTHAADLCIHLAVHCEPMGLGLGAAAGWIHACTAVFRRQDTNRAVPMRRHISVILRISSISCGLIVVRTCQPGRLCHPHAQGMCLGNQLSPQSSTQHWAMLLLLVLCCQRVNTCSDTEL